MKRIKAKPIKAWAVIDAEGMIFAVHATRNSASKFARDWSNEVADTSCVFGYRGKHFELCSFPDLYIAQVEIK